jgi:cytochrome c oxidase subunit II
MNKIFSIVIVLLIIGGGYFVMKQNAAGSQSEAVVDPNAKVFEVVGSNFAFDVKEIKVKKGDTVRINFTNKEGRHDWVVDELNARTQIIEGGSSDSITFVADKAGTFEYYCSVMEHRKMGMVGKLIVEE